MQNPGSVDASWQRLFAELRDEPAAIDAELRGASWAPRKTGLLGNGEEPAAKTRGGNGAAVVTVGVDQIRAATLDSVLSKARMCS